MTPSRSPKTTQEMRGGAANPWSVPVGATFVAVKPRNIHAEHDEHVKKGGLLVRKPDDFSRETWSPVVRQKKESQP